MYQDIKFMSDLRTFRIPSPKEPKTEIGVVVWLVRAQFKDKPSISVTDFTSPQNNNIGSNTPIFNIKRGSKATEQLEQLRNRYNVPDTQAYDFLNEGTYILLYCRVRVAAAANDAIRFDLETFKNLNQYPNSALGLNRLSVYKVGKLIGDITAQNPSLKDTGSDFRQLLEIMSRKEPISQSQLPPAQKKKITIPLITASPYTENPMFVPPNELGSQIAIFHDGHTQQQQDDSLSSEVIMDSMDEQLSSSGSRIPLRNASHMSIPIPSDTQESDDDDDEVEQITESQMWRVLNKTPLSNTPQSTEPSQEVVSTDVSNGISQEKSSCLETEVKKEHNDDENDENDNDIDNDDNDKALSVDNDESDSLSIQGTIPSTSQIGNDGFTGEQEEEEDEEEDEEIINSDAGSPQGSDHTHGDDQFFDADDGSQQTGELELILDGSTFQPDEIVQVSVHLIACVPFKPRIVGAAFASPPNTIPFKMLVSHLPRTHLDTLIPGKNCIALDFSSKNTILKFIGIDDVSKAYDDNLRTITKLWKLLQYDNRIPIQLVRKRVYRGFWYKDVWECMETLDDMLKLVRNAESVDG